MAAELPNRRDFLRAGVASTAAVLGCATTPGTKESVRTAPLRTELCELLGIEYPILQAGMAPVAGPELVAAVSAAGGLGILAAAHMAPDEVRTRRVSMYTCNISTQAAINSTLGTDVSTVYRYCTISSTQPLK